MTKAQERALNPLESEEQAALFEWAQVMEGRLPELRLLYHVPNGGLRNKAVAARLTAQGVKAGVPDICLPVARKGYHGLYIELKRRKGSKTTPEQDWWIRGLAEAGNFCQICHGWESAVRAIEWYVGVARPIENGNY